MSVGDKAVGGRIRGERERERGGRHSDVSLTIFAYPSVHQVLVQRAEYLSNLPKPLPPSRGVPLLEVNCLLHSYKF